MKITCFLICLCLAKVLHIVSYNAIPYILASDHLPLPEYLTKQ